MTEEQGWWLVGAAVVSAISLFFVAHNVEKIARHTSAIADLLRQIRNRLDKE